MAWVSLPDSQLVTYDLSIPHACLDWDEVLKQDSSSKSNFPSKIVKNVISKCIWTSHVSSTSLSEVAAVREGFSYKSLIIKMIAVKQVSDGLSVCYTGDMLTLDKAFECGLIPASIYVNVLQHQKTCRDMIYTSTAKNEAEPDTEPCEVSKCLSRNEPLTSGRSVTALSLVHDDLGERETRSRFIDDQVGAVKPEESPNVIIAEVIDDIVGLNDYKRLKVDVCVECDLMNSSSILVTLGNQWQLMGLVLPQSEETQTVHEGDTTANEFTSRLSGNRQKIAALYIPENAEVAEIDSATRDGFIDSYTAEFLKSVEIPDFVCPDFDKIRDKFASWPMSTNLSADGSCDAADCLQNQSSPFSTEERQLFISYLTVNSYIDQKMGQRVLILDKQMSKMVQLFLDGFKSLKSEKTETNVASLNFKISDVPEEDDSEDPMHTNEGTMEFMKNPLKHFKAHSLVSSVTEVNMFDDSTEHAFDPHGFVTAENGKITLNEYTCADEKILIQEFSDRSGNMFNGNRISTQVESDEHAEGICENAVTVDTKGVKSDALDIPPLEKSVLPTLCTMKSTRVASSSKMCDSGASAKACCPTLPHHDAEGSESNNADLNPAKVLCSRALVESGCERAQVELLSGRCSDPEEVLKRRQADKTTALRLLDVQSGDQGSLIGDAESDSSISSNIALSMLEMQSLSRSDCTNIFGEFGLDIDSDNSFKLHPKASIEPEGNCSHFIPDDHNLDSIKHNEAENIQQSIDSESLVLGLSLVNEAEGEETDTESRNSCVMRGNVSNSLHQATCAVSSCEPLMSSWSQVTAASSHPTDASRLAAGGGDSREGTDHVTDSGGICQVVTQPAVQFHPCSRVDGACSGVADTQSDTGAAHSPLGTELSHSIDDSYPGVLAESGSLFISKVPCECGKNITGESGRTTLHQQEVLCPEHDFIESEPRCSQSGQTLKSSSQTPLLASENNTEANAFNDRSCDVESPTGNVCLESLPTNKDLNSELSGPADGFDLCMKRQHVGSSSDSTEEMFVSRSVIGKIASASCHIHSAECKMLTAEQLVSEPITASDSRLTSDMASSAQCEIMANRIHVSDLHMAQSQDSEGSVPVVENTTTFYGRDMPREHVEDSHKDLQVDLLKQESLSSTNKEGAQEFLLQEEKLQCDPPHIQLQLLQVLKTVSSSRDLSMLQEVMDTLHGALGGGCQEDRWRTLESIAEEDEGSAEEALVLSSFGAQSQPPAPRFSAKTVARNVEEVKKKVHPAVSDLRYMLLVRFCQILHQLHFILSLLAAVLHPGFLRVRWETPGSR